MWLLSLAYMRNRYHHCQMIPFKERKGEPWSWFIVWNTIDDNKRISVGKFTWVIYWQTTVRLSGQIPSIPQSGRLQMFLTINSSMTIIQELWEFKNLWKAPGWRTDLKRACTVLVLYWYIQVQVIRMRSFCHVLWVLPFLITYCFFSS